MQAILAAITNDPHHFSNLMQVFSPYEYPGSFHLVAPPFPKVCIQAEEEKECGESTSAFLLSYSVDSQITSAHIQLVRTGHMTSLSCKGSWEM